jgi:hypothetical protein
MYLLLKDGVLFNTLKDVPLCSTCKHFKQLNFSAVCTSGYNKIIEPVFGSNCTFQETCMVCRSDVLVNGCGPLGSKWEPKA